MFPVLLHIWVGLFLCDYFRSTISFSPKGKITKYINKGGGPILLKNKLLPSTENTEITTLNIVSHQRWE